MAENMRLYLELMGKSNGLRNELNNSRSAVSRFTSGVKREFSSMRNVMGSVQGQLAAVGISFGAVKTMADSAGLDKSLTRIKQTAGASAGEMANLRRELFAMARQTGQPIEGLRAGFESLVASGLDLKSAMEAIKAVNIGSAVTTAQAPTLSGGLTVGATAFNFDLSNPGLALELLDKMTVAGRQGNAELESLADIFARVGVNAASAGMNFDKTLAFIEGLSLVERQPERLATLADSTLRLFNNVKYMKDAQKATGVRFFESNGARRDSLAIIADIKKRYDQLKTDKARAMFIQQAFGHADLDTQKGMKNLLQGDALAKVEQFSQNIGNAGGTLKRDLGEATNNLVDQVGMLKSDLREAADGFVKPMNATLGEWIKWVREPKEKGGAGLDGNDMIKYGAGGGLAALLLGRYGGKAIGKLFSGAGGVASGVVQGKALEEVAGVTPVFVVNMPGSTFSSGPSIPTTKTTGAVVAGGGAMLAGVPAAPVVIGTAGAMLGASMVHDAFFSPRDNADAFSGYGAESGDVPDLGVLISDLFAQYRENYINQITMDITVDQNGRVTSSTDDPNTKSTINVRRRGSFGYPSQE